MVGVTLALTCSHRATSQYVRYWHLADIAGCSDLCPLSEVKRTSRSASAIHNKESHTNDPSVASHPHRSPSDRLHKTEQCAYQDSAAIGCICVCGAQPIFSGLMARLRRWFFFSARNLSASTFCYAARVDSRVGALDWHT